MKKVIIIGGGFGGVNLAAGLAGKKDFDVTIVDRNNYNFFPPLLYQIATGYLETSNISYPFRKLWRGKENIHFHMAEFQQVNPAEKTIVLSTGVMKYDYLVFATGTKTNYLFLVNYRNRIRTLYNWLTAYFSKDQTLRMIIRPDSKHKRAA